MKSVQTLKTYPSNKELTKKHNFLPNVPMAERKSEYVKVTKKDNATKTVKSRVHLSQRDSNVLKSVLNQWYLKVYDNKKNETRSEWLQYDLSQASTDLEMNNYTFDKDNKRVSSNKTNNIRDIKRRVDNILSFVIELELDSCIHKFHFIEEVKQYSDKPNILEIKLSKSFLKTFLDKKLQIVPLLVVKGEYEQKILEYLLTEVQTRQNLVGIHQGRKYRFKNFSIENCVQYMQIKAEYKNKPDKIRRQISNALKSVQEQINARGESMIIPKYRYVNGVYEVKDYCYEIKGRGGI
jgi:hypothetical protein